MSGHFINMSGQTYVTPYILSGHPNEVIIVPVHSILVGTSAELVLILFTLPLMAPHRNKQLLSYINVILVPGYIKTTQCIKKNEGNKILSISRLVIFNAGVKIIYVHMH